MYFTEQSRMARFMPFFLNFLFVLNTAFPLGQLLQTITVLTRESIGQGIFLRI